MLGNVEGINFVREIPEEVSPSHLFMMDIIEHIESGLVFLKKFVRISSPGDFSLITVPAFKQLWSEHDEILEHKRRYSLREIEQLAIIPVWKLSKVVIFLLRSCR